MFRIQSFLKSHTQSTKRTLTVVSAIVMGLLSPVVVASAAFAAPAPAVAPVELKAIAPIKWGEQPENCVRAYLVPYQASTPKYNYSVHTTIDGKPLQGTSNDYNWRVFAGQKSKTVETANRSGDYFVLADGSHVTSVSFTVNYNDTTPYCRDALPVCQNSQATIAYNSVPKFDALANCTDSDDTVIKLDSGQSYYTDSSGAYVDAGTVTVVKNDAGKKVLRYNPNFPLAPGHSQTVDVYYVVEDGSYGRSTGGKITVTVQN